MKNFVIIIKHAEIHVNIETLKLKFTFGDLNNSEITGPNIIPQAQPRAANEEFICK